MIKKKILLLSAILSFGLVLYAQDVEQIYSFKDFGAGLNLKTNPLLIPENQSPDCQNVYFDQTDLLSKRTGYDVFCALPSTGTVLGGYEYTRSSGEKWLIVQILTAIYGSKDNGLTWTMIKKDLSLISPCNYTQYLDQLWVTNGFDDVFTFNGSSTQAYGFMPKGKYIETHFDQVFIGNTPENNSAIYWNDIYYGPTAGMGWQGFNAFNIGGDDGDKITGLKSEKGNLVVFKTNSTWGILGSGSDMSLYKYSNFYGAVSQNSIGEYKSDLLFLSKRGLCAFNNGNIKQIDRAVEERTKNSLVSMGTAIKKEWIQTSDVDFWQGAISSITIINGTIRMETPDVRNEDNSQVFVGVADTLRGDRRLPCNATGGTGFQMAVVGGWVHLSPNYDFRSYTIQNIQVNLSRSLTNIYQSSVCMEVWNANETLIATQTKFITDLANGSWYDFFNTTSTYIDTIYKDLHIVLYVARISGGASGFGYLIHFAYVPEVWNYGSFNVSDVDYLAVCASYISNGWIITGRIAVYDGSGNFSGWKVSMKKMVRAEAEKVSELALQWQYQVLNSTWGYYISQKYDAGDNINQWKYFITSGNGNISYFIRYGTSTTSSIFSNNNTNWTAINNGGLILATTSQKIIQWKAILNNIHSSINSVTLQYLEGAAVNYQDCSSAFFDNRYYISFATSGVTNNLNIVMDNNGAFTQWNMPVGVFIPYDNNLLFSKNNDYQLYNALQGHNDNGAAINGYWKSKYCDMGSSADKKVVKVGITAKGSGNLIVGYKANYEVNFSTICIPLTSSEDNYVVNLPASINRAKYWQFQLSNNTVGGFFDVIRFDVFWIPYELRQR